MNKLLRVLLLGLSVLASDELHHGIVEAWAGYTVALAEGYSFTYSIRGHTSELKQGNGHRNALGWLAGHQNFRLMEPTFFLNRGIARRNSIRIAV